MAKMKFGRFEVENKEIKLVGDWIAYWLMEEFADDVFISHYEKKEEEFSGLWWLENVIKTSKPEGWDEEFKDKLLEKKLPKKFSTKEFEFIFPLVLKQFGPQYRELKKQNEENNQEVLKEESLLENQVNEIKASEII